MAGEFDYDLIVIGGGSGGVRCARTAARLGAKVACVEARFWGGTCVNVGCVPKKIYVMGSEFSYQMARASGFGWTGSGFTHDWGTLQRAMTAEVSRLNSIYSNLLQNSGVDRFWGQARFVDSPVFNSPAFEGHRIAVGEQVISARFIVIATGSQPSLPDIPGVEHVLTSDQFFAMTSLPKASIVLGGGYIAVELAGILNAAGSETTLIYRGEKILRGFDHDVRSHTQQCLQERGINVRTQCRVKSVESQGGHYSVVLQDGEVIEADCVLAATGRIPQTTNLGLENVGVTHDSDSGIKVDEHYETSRKGVFAVGDVLNKMQLTPVALAEGMYVANRLFNGSAVPINYTNIATAVFSQPSIACVGLTEDGCLERGRPYKLYRSRFAPMSNAFSESKEKALLKILVDAETDKVLGMHMVGDNAGEIIQGFAAALTCGITKQQLDSTIGIHPTVAEELVTMRDVSEVISP